MNLRLLSLSAAATCLTLPAAAMARDAAEEESVFDGEHLTVGLGGYYGPSYDGSDDYAFSPFPAIQGKVHGIKITPRLGGVALDLIPDGKDARIGFSLGPVASLSFNRKTNIKDPVVKAAGKLGTAAELGINGGVTAYKLLNPYDSLSLSVDVKWDIADAHKGMSWSPSITYFTPVSKAVLMAVSARARHADGKYARYYYSVTPEQSAASGLPGYSASSGWDSAGIGTLVAWDMSGDMRDGGWALFGIADYTHMLNDGKRTPFTAIRGQASQWTAGGGMAYTF